MVNKYKKYNKACLQMENFVKIYDSERTEVFHGHRNQRRAAQGSGRSGDGFPKEKLTVRWTHLRIPWTHDSNGLVQIK